MANRNPNPKNLELSSEKKPPGEYDRVIIACLGQTPAFSYLATDWTSPEGHRLGHYYSGNITRRLYQPSRLRPFQLLTEGGRVEAFLFCRIERGTESFRVENTLRDLNNELEEVEEDQRLARYTAMVDNWLEKFMKDFVYSRKQADGNFQYTPWSIQTRRMVENPPPMFTDETDDGLGVTTIQKALGMGNKRKVASSEPAANADKSPAKRTRSAATAAAAAEAAKAKEKEMIQRRLEEASRKVAEEATARKVALEIARREEAEKKAEDEARKAAAIERAKRYLEEEAALKESERAFQEAAAMAAQARIARLEKEEQEKQAAIVSQARAASIIASSADLEAFQRNIDNDPTTFSEIMALARSNPQSSRSTSVPGTPAGEPAGEPTGEPVGLDTAFIGAATSGEDVSSNILTATDGGQVTFMVSEENASQLLTNVTEADNMNITFKVTSSGELELESPMPMQATSSRTRIAETTTTSTKEPFGSRYNAPVARKEPDFGGQHKHELVTRGYLEKCLHELFLKMKGALKDEIEELKGVMDKDRTSMSKKLDNKFATVLEVKKTVKSMNEKFIDVSQQVKNSPSKTYLGNIDIRSKARAILLRLIPFNLMGKSCDVFFAFHFVQEQVAAFLLPYFRGQPLSTLHYTMAKGVMHTIFTTLARAHMIVGKNTNSLKNLYFNKRPIPEGVHAMIDKSIVPALQDLYKVKDAPEGKHLSEIDQYVATMLNTDRGTMLTTAGNRAQNLDEAATAVTDVDFEFYVANMHHKDPKKVVPSYDEHLAATRKRSEFSKTSFSGVCDNPKDILSVLNNSSQEVLDVKEVIRHVIVAAHLMGQDWQNLTYMRIKAVPEFPRLYEEVVAETTDINTLVRRFSADASSYLPDVQIETAKAKGSGKKSSKKSERKQTAASVRNLSAAFESESEPEPSTSAAAAAELTRDQSLYESDYGEEEEQEIEPPAVLSAPDVPTQFQTDSSSDNSQAVDK